MRSIGGPPLRSAASLSAAASTATPGEWGIEGDVYPRSERGNVPARGIQAVGPEHMQACSTIDAPYTDLGRNERNLFGLAIVP